MIFLFPRWDMLIPWRVFEIRSVHFFRGEKCLVSGEGIKLQYESEETWKETFQDATADIGQKGVSYPHLPIHFKGHL